MSDQFFLQHEHTANVRRALYDFFQRPVDRRTDSRFRKRAGRLRRKPGRSGITGTLAKSGRVHLPR